MKENYFLQNMGYYDKPLNIKHVVLELLKNTGLFIHMRDERREKMYDKQNVSMKTNQFMIPYHKQNIERARNKIKKLRGHEECIIKDIQTAYNFYYRKGLEEYKNKLENTEDIEELQRCIRSLRNKRDALQQFQLNDLRGIERKDISKLLFENIEEWICQLTYDIARKEEELYNLSQLKENLSIEDYRPLEIAEWRRKELDDIHNQIDFLEKRIKEEEECISNLLERDKVIDNIYDVLDKVDTDIE